MNFFLDRNLSPNLAVALNAVYGIHPVHAHDDKFDRQTSDIEWLKQLGEGEEEWAVISGDNRLLTIPQERAELRKYKMPVYVLVPTWIKMGLPEQAWRLTKDWPTMVENATTTNPAIYRVSMRVKLSLVERLR